MRFFGLLPTLGNNFFFRIMADISFGQDCYQRKPGPWYLLLSPRRLTRMSLRMTICLMV